MVRKGFNTPTQSVEEKISEGFRSLNQGTTIKRDDEIGESGDRARRPKLHVFEYLKLGKWTRELIGKSDSGAISWIHSLIELGRCKCPGGESEGERDQSSSNGQDKARIIRRNRFQWSRVASTELRTPGGSLPEISRDCSGGAGSVIKLREQECQVNCTGV
jgi:hypothetical protein